MLAAAAAVQTDRIRIGTFVPFLLSHPALVAHRALTLQALSGGRSMICLIAGDRVFIERALGVEYGDPVEQLEPYLDVLLPLLRQEPVRRRSRLSSTRSARCTGRRASGCLAHRFPAEPDRDGGIRCAGVGTTMAGPRYLAQ